MRFTVIHRDGCTYLGKRYRCDAELEIDEQGHNGKQWIRALTAARRIAPVASAPVGLVDSTQPAHPQLELPAPPAPDPAPPAPPPDPTPEIPEPEPAKPAPRRGRYSRRDLRAED